MNDPAGGGHFSCCIQCDTFWDCSTRAGNHDTIRGNECCSQCGKYEICKIVNEKVKEGLKKAV